VRDVNHCGSLPRGSGAGNYFKLPAPTSQRADLLESSGLIVLDQLAQRTFIELMQDIAEPFIVLTPLPKCRAIILAEPTNEDVAVLVAYIAILVAITFEGHDIFQSPARPRGALKDCKQRRGPVKGLFNWQGPHRSAL
jgi:hypothetical protein